MSATKTYTTRKFTEPAIAIRWLTFWLMSAALVASWFLGREQISQTVYVEPNAEGLAEVGELQLKPNAIGATRIRAEARVPSNHSVTYELRLVDSQGEVVASAMKEAWAQSGTWQEDGESGTWSEDDLGAGLDVRATETESLTLGVSVLDYTTTDGIAVATPVPIEVRASTGVIYRTPLFWGWIVTTILTVIAGEISHAGIGKRAIFRTIPDSDVSARGTLGGPSSLVYMRVTIDSDENTPLSFQPQLWIRNADGEDIYTQTYTLKSSGSGDERKTVLDGYFRLLEKGSYGFYLEVLPDASVDRTTLAVFDRARSSGSVEVTDIENVAIADVDGLTDLEADSQPSGPETEA
ncbi:MAG: hypothetical protein ACFB9N_16445 [Geitlerinemataceae cyanobacterium]